MANNNNNRIIKSVTFATPLDEQQIKEMKVAQSGRVPKVMFFIWMGKKQIPGDTYIGQDGDGQFRRDIVERNVKANPNLDKTMWLVALSIVPDDIIRRALVENTKTNSDFALSMKYFLCAEATKKRRDQSDDSKNFGLYCEGNFGRPLLESESGWPPTSSG